MHYNAKGGGKNDSMTRSTKQRCDGSNEDVMLDMKGIVGLLYTLR